MDECGGVISLSSRLSVCLHLLAQPFCFFLCCLLMGKEPGTRPSFFKILLGDFSKRLKIPPRFVKHFKGNRPKKFVLQSTIGKSWYVRVKKINNSWFLQKGWRRFVMYHSLQIGDFLVFKFNGKSKFLVIVYDKSACEKEFPSAKRRSCKHEEVKPICHIKKEEEEEEEEPVSVVCGTVVPKRGRIKRNVELEAVSSFKTESPHFIHILREYRKYYLTVPRALAYKNGLANRGSTVLQVPHGKSQRVLITQKKDGRINIGAGWFDFRKANNLVNGDACVFEFIREKGNAICVHIFRSPAPEIVYVGPSSYGASATGTVKTLTHHDASDDETE